MKINVILVHGIGNQSSDWAEKIILQLKKQFLATLKKIDPASAAKSVDEALFIKPVHWADIFQERQKVLCAKLNADGQTPPKEVRGPFWMGLKIRTFDAMKAMFKNLQDAITTEFIGDVIGYLDPKAKKVVYAKLDDGLNTIAQQSKGHSEKIPVSFIAHSLGTVITSDFIYNGTEEMKARGARGFHSDFTLDNLFTLGAPIALFSLRYGGPEVFQNPIRIETMMGRWINMYDDDDPVGMPLTSLNDAYKSAVFKDVHVESGIFGLAHMHYFEKPEILEIMAKKLAIDWLAYNFILPEDKIQKLYIEYDLKVSR